MRKGSVGGNKILLAIADAATIFAPRHLARIGSKIRACDTMVNADL